MTKSNTPAQAPAGKIPNAGHLLERQTRIIGPSGQAVRRFRRHHLAMTGFCAFFVITVMAILAPLVSQYEPNHIDLMARNQPPSLDHWFGTDRTGRDIYARVIYGGRVSITVGVAAVVISLVIGLVLGAVAGFFGGVVDNAIMRFTDIILTFPPIVIILTVAAIAGPGIQNTILVIGLLNWPVPCRLVRAKFLSVRQTEYVTAARAIGAPTPRIIGLHALPNVADVMIVYASLGMATAILLEAGLSFLGLGVQQPIPSWGNMLNVARNISVLESAPWLWVPAGAAIVLTVLAVNLIGDGLRDALDPRMKV